MKEQTVKTTTRYTIEAPVKLWGLIAQERAITGKTINTIIIERLTESYDEVFTEADTKRLANIEDLPDGQPCSHPGCLSHISHPCEVCGRIAGIKNKKGD